MAKIIIAIWVIIAIILFIIIFSIIDNDKKNAKQDTLSSSNKYYAEKENEDIKINLEKKENRVEINEYDVVGFVCGISVITIFPIVGGILFIQYGFISLGIILILLGIIGTIIVIVGSTAKKNN